MGALWLGVFKKLFKLIDRPWKMYPLGVLFGLGFDTSSEIAVLGIASVQGARGTSIWLILIFPVLFTGELLFHDLDGTFLTVCEAGMCLLDTTDGALMMTLYTSTSLARDTIAILYYSIVLSAITVMVAICIGTIQLLSLIANFSTGSFWDGVNAIGDHFDVIGGGICGAFVVFGAASVIVYGPWRRRMDRRRRTGVFDAVELENLDDKKKEEDDEKNTGGEVMEEIMSVDLFLSTQYSDLQLAAIERYPTILHFRTASKAATLIE